MKKTRANYLRFYLGIAREKEKEELFNSEEFDSAIWSEWEGQTGAESASEPFHKEKVYGKILEGIEKKEPRTIVLSFIQKYAAILVIGLLAGTAILYFSIYKGRVGENEAFVEVYNEKGISSEIILIDGSKVILNANTRFSYPKKISGKNRIVLLEGEAFFDVEAHRNKTFSIKTRDVVVEVLGTRFSVQAYPGEDFTETLLLSGKVRIRRINPQSKKTQSVVLTPNHKARFIRDEERFILDKADAKNEISWISGSIVIENEMLGNLVPKLERKYDVEIILGDEKAGKNMISMRIDDESLEEVLIILKKTLPIEYRKEGKKIIIFSED